MIVCYDLAISPPSFDCISFVLHVNGLKRQDELKILISPGPRDGFRPDNCWPLETEIRKKLLDGIVVPACKMATSSVEVLNEPIDLVYGCGRRRYGIEFLVEEFKLGNRSLRPIQELAKNDKLITITLREADHWPERNSDVGEWIKVAQELSKSYRVVFIRDTAKVDEPFDYETDRIASIDLDYRGALYRSAFCNLFANNGPAWFCFAIDAPAIVCKLVTGDGWYYSENFWRHYGIKDQFPGSPTYQRVTFDTDKFEVIMREFEKWSLTNE